MSGLRYACGRCGTWTCSACGGQRTSTDTRYVNYRCGGCWRLDGVLIPTMHTERMWHTHNEGGLPFPYPYGQRPPQEEWGAGFGPRTVPAPRYRGVPLPGPEEFGQVDVRSWSMGVDDMLRERSQ